MQNVSRPEKSMTIALHIIKCDSPAHILRRPGNAQLRRLNKTSAESPFATARLPFAEVVTLVIRASILIKLYRAEKQTYNTTLSGICQHI